MNKQKAFAIARESWKGNKPARIAGFSVDQGVLCLVAHEEDTVLVVYDQRDLYKLKSMCEMLLAKPEGK